MVLVNKSILKPRKKTKNQKQCTGSLKREKYEENNIKIGDNHPCNNNVIEDQYL